MNYEKIDPGHFATARERTEKRRRAEKRPYRAFRRMFGIRRITPARRRRLIRPTGWLQRLADIQGEIKGGIWEVVK